MYQKKKDREYWVVLPPEKEFYSIEEVAEILHINKATVQRYITNDVIKAEEINGGRMVSRKSLCQRLSELGQLGIYGITVTEVDL